MNRKVGADKTVDGVFQIADFGFANLFGIGDVKTHFVGGNH